MAAGRAAPLPCRSLAARRPRPAARRVLATAQSGQAAAEPPPAPEPAPPPPVGVVARLRSFFGGAARLDRARLATLGTSALLSYGAVSNVSAVSIIITAWVVFTRASGLSPLAPGQLPKFMATYVGLYAIFGNGLRPLRFSLSVAAAPLFDRLVSAIQRRLGCGKRAAFAATVLLVNVCGSFSYLFGGLWAVTTLLRLPLLP